MIYVRRILNDNFVTQVDLAKHLGIDRSHLNKLINGNHKPTMKTIRFLGQGLERIDGQPWQLHAKHIRDEVEGGRPVTLRIVGGNDE